MARSIVDKVAFHARLEVIQLSLSLAYRIDSCNIP